VIADVFLFLGRVEGYGALVTHGENVRRERMARKRAYAL
jgi:hypothetical protein